jgi:hypothetical protein
MNQPAATHAAGASEAHGWRSVGSPQRKRPASAGRVIRHVVKPTCFGSDSRTTKPRATLRGQRKRRGRSGAENVETIDAATLLRPRVRVDPHQSTDLRHRDDQRPDREPPCALYHAVLSLLAD